MASVTKEFTLKYPSDFNEQSVSETVSRGYLSDVVVEMPTGMRFQVFFIDPTRLQQELADEIQAGREYFAEPNMIVVPQVDRSHIELALRQMYEDAYFEQLKPL